MTELTLENTFTEENIQKALIYILSRKNSCGIDGVYIKDFEEYWRINGENIVGQILHGKYKNAPVQLREWVMPTGKRRKIAMYTCTDRLVMRIISEALQERTNIFLSEYSFAYRKNKGVIPAVEYAGNCIQQGKTWVLEIDIENFFDNIDLTLLEQELREWIGDKHMIELIRKFLYCTVIENGNTFYYVKERGVVQGSSLSPVLSNLYLHKMDQELEKAKFTFCRFGDNINIYFQNEKEAAEIYIWIKEKLENEFCLRINQNKCGVYRALNRTFLGYSFKQDKDGTVIIYKKPKRKLNWYSSWRTSAIQYTGKEYHIINDGILTRKDYTLLFETKDDKKFLPVEVTEKLNIYSDVILTSNFFEYMAKHDIDVAIFNQYGKFCGLFCCNRHAASSNLIVKQASFYNDERKRLFLAKSMITAAVHNMRSNVRYYYKKNRLQKEDIDCLTAFIRQINEAVSIQSLLLTEAQCRQYYYTVMRRIIDSQEFNFQQRRKRPPQDEVNAMISFGNVFLYEKIATEIHKSSLDIKIGFLHATNRRQNSLNLDIAEIFKPLIVDRVIFTVIHKKILKASEHFEPFGENGIYLNAEGKKRFIYELRKKLYSRITVRNHSITYHALIKNEIWKIQQLIEKGEKYKPYKNNN